MSEPQRFQLRRTKGWRKPPNGIVVARPSKWGNPFKPWQEWDRGCGWVYGVAVGDRPIIDMTLGSHDDAVRACVDLFEDFITANLFGIEELRGHDLGCWCPLGTPCHADVLLRLANDPLPERCICGHRYGDHTATVDGLTFGVSGRMEDFIETRPGHVIRCKRCECTAVRSAGGDLDLGLVAP